MKTLNVEQRLRFALRGVAVLRKLKATNKTMRHEKFARAIGLLAKIDPWTVQQREQVSAILSEIAAVQRDGRGGRDRTAAPLDFGRIVDQHGKPGAGIAKNSRIVWKP